MAPLLRIESFARGPFTGWLLGNTDLQDGDGMWPATVLGRKTGLDTRSLHLFVGNLRPGDKLELQALHEVTPTPVPAMPNVDPVQHFGGGLQVDGIGLLDWVSREQDGAAMLAHLRGRDGDLLCVDVWLIWYPGEPWMRGEILLDASDPSIADRFWTSQGHKIHFGDSVCHTVGAGFGAPVAPLGARFADGQGRAIPIAFFWPRLCRDLERDLASFAALASGGLSVRALQQLLPDGNPHLPAGFSARQWVGNKLAESARRLHTFERAVVGPNPTSGDTGMQEDQVFVRGECMAPDGGGCETIAYLSALKFANRPCHHLEPNGEPLDWRGHTNPRLVLWDMRPHWHPAVSPDRLGNKAISLQDASGWWGADVEHALFNTLAAASRLTGSPVLQRLLDQAARNYLFQWTVQPGLSTSQPFAARAYGWEGILCVHLWRGLEDRALAQAVADRWRARFDAFAWMLPNLDIRTDDPRLGPGQRWMPWQEAVKAYGMDLAGQHLGRPQAREIAFAHAVKILDDAFVQAGATDAPALMLPENTVIPEKLIRHPAVSTLTDGGGTIRPEYEDSLPDIWPLMQSALMNDAAGFAGMHAAAGQWTTKDVVAVDGAPTTVGYFNLFGMPLAWGTVLRHDPAHEKALSIRQQFVPLATRLQDTAWLAPGV